MRGPGKRLMRRHLAAFGPSRSLHTFMAPETAERTADFIRRFALGEMVTRPIPDLDDNN